MRIDRIELHNYRQYRNVTIEFPKKPCDLHVMLAEGGCGKSTLLNSLEWCLYGREPHRQKASTTLESMPRYNLAALDDLRARGGKTDKISVTVIFSNDSGIYKISRTQKVTIDPAGKLFESQTSEPLFYHSETGVKTLGGFNIDPDLAKEEILRFLPEDVGKFFFFDGEQLHNFFSQAPDMTKAVENISRVDLIKRCIEHLDAFTKELRKEASKANPDLEGLERKIAETESELVQAKEERDTKIKEREKAEVKIKELSQVIKGFESLSAYEKQRDDARQEIAILEDRHRHFMEERMSTTREYMTLLTLMPSLMKVRAYIADAKKRNQLPPPVDKNMLSHFLEKGLCGVCGHALDGAAQKHIEELVKLLAVGTKVSHRLTEIDVSISDFIDKVRKYPKTMSDMRDNFAMLAKERSHQEQLFNEAEEYIGQCADSEKVKQAISDRESNERVLKRLNDDIPYCRIRIEGLEKQLSDSKTEYDQALAKAKGLELTKKKLKFLSEAMSGMASVRDQVVTEVRTSIEKETNDRLGKLMWKKECGQFRLTDGYHVDLVSKYKGQDIEYSILESRSAGEFNVLALAFTLALHSCSGFESFLCIDTPVARLGPKFRERVAPILAQIAKESQTILLLTPSEYSSEIQSVFSREAATIRTIDLKDNEARVEVSK